MTSVTGCSVWNWLPLSTRFHAAVQAATHAFQGKHPAGGPTTRLFEDSETQNANQDQVQRDDVIQQARHNENQDTGHECNDGLNMGNADAHELSPFVAVRCALTAMRGCLDDVVKVDDDRIATRRTGTGILDGSARDMFPERKNFQR
jgi:hypothetical protein